ncbi:MAG: hypothetical protein WCR72_07155, partial [Bacteroidota bacterium]
MKPVFKYLFLLFPAIWSICLSCQAQSNEWQWVKTFGGKNADGINSSCIDKSDNIYVAGYFQDKLDIDGKTLKSNGDTDAFIAKFDDSGNLIWIRQIGGNYTENMVITEYAKKIEIDAEGNIVVAGIFAWDASIGNFTLHGAGNNDIFILKYTPAGELIWAKSFGSYSHDNLFDMDIDGAGNIYFSCLLNGPLKQEEGNAPLDEIPLGSQTYIIKLDPSGKIAWIRRDAGVADNTQLAIDRNNFVYYGITYSLGLTIDGKYIESQGNSDFLIQQIDTKGT